MASHGAAVICYPLCHPLFTDIFGSAARPGRRLAVPIAPTHGSLGQLSILVGAPVAYSRHPPGPLGGINLQHGLTKPRAGQIKTPETEDGRTKCRAVTGPAYGRIHDPERVLAGRCFAGNDTGNLRRTDQFTGDRCQRRSLAPMLIAMFPCQSSRTFAELGRLGLRDLLPRCLFHDAQFYESFAGVDSGAGDRDAAAGGLCRNGGCRAVFCGL